MMKNRIILIEDDKNKINDIKLFLSSSFQINDITVKESWQSGVKELMNSEFDLLLLDMSIPTWDKSSNETGGSFEKFGGYKILREIFRKERPVKTILITMFDDFGESDNSITLNQLDDALKSDFPDFYLGAIYYNASQNKWQKDLSEILKKQLE